MFLYLQCLKIRTFSNLPIFHCKQNIIIILQFILLIAIIYSRRENKKKYCWNNPLIKSTVYLLIFHQISMTFNLGSLYSPLHQHEKKDRRILSRRGYQISLTILNTSSSRGYSIPTLTPAIHVPFSHCSFTMFDQLLKLIRL